MTGLGKLTAAAAMAAGTLVVASTDHQPYAGQDARDIASLSADDVTALLAGDGWGLAKPAELNGYPGPAHILELADDLDLTETQRTSVQAVFDAMKVEARALGAAYVDSEAHLSRMFAAGHADADRLQKQLGKSSQLLADLRAVHLRAHLTVTPMLNEIQIETYARLRGYASGEDAGHSGHGNH